MGRIVRVKVNWTGFPGSPGYTNFHFEPAVEANPWTQPDVEVAVSKVQTWLTAMKSTFPPSVITGIDPVVTELDEVNGDIQAFWNVATTAASAGTGGTTYTSGAGFCITWGTDGVRKGRRVRGRTFVVPIAGANFEADGSLSNASITGWRNNAVALAASGSNARLVVWAHDPKALIPDGGAYAVTSANIKDRPAFLTSRRG